MCGARCFTAPRWRLQQIVTLHVFLLYGMYSLQAESFVIGHGDKHALGFNAACVLALYTSSSKFLGSIIQPIPTHLDLDRVLRQVVASWDQALSEAQHV